MYRRYNRIMNLRLARKNYPYHLDDNFKIVDKYSYSNDISYFLFIIQFHYSK